MRIQTVLWVDGIAALVAGLFVLALRDFLASLFALPPTLLLVLALVSVGYAAYSLTLASRGLATRRLVKILVAANLAYGLNALVLLSIFHATASWLGVAWFLVESAFVCGLAIVEWRRLDQCR